MDTERPPLRAHLDDIEGEADSVDRDEVLSSFLDYVTDLGLEPYPAQEEAILELLSWKHVILNTPTGSGKSLVALALHFQATAEGRVSYYTAPTKALVNEKFFALCEAFGADMIGLLTGDASVNHDAPIICCTAEVLSNMTLRQDDVGVEYVVMDEFHYYGDRDRGVAWQIPLITMRDSQFLLMSATLGDTTELEERLASMTNRKVAVVRGAERPVPLEFEYRETTLHDAIADLLEAGEAPIYLVNFTQKSCAEQAQNLMSINVCSKEEKREIGRDLEEVIFDTPYGKEFQRFVRHGLGVHHAGLLPKYRRIVERLSQRGLIKVISGTDTLGVGVNIPIRTVLIKQLYKFDGEKTRILSARQFHQVAGRAGRKGFDDHGRVVVLAPEWVVENQKIDQKLVSHPHLKKKLVKKRPPDGAIQWSEKTFNKLVTSPPEPLEPQFEVTHAMLINLLQADIDAPGGGYGRLMGLIERVHGTPGQRSHHRRRAAALLRSLLKAGVVDVIPGDDGPARIEVRPDLQADFSLNQTLSLYLVQSLELIDRDSDDYHLEALTLVEAILENPRVVLYRQIHRLRGELIGKLKAEGMPYEERMMELEKVEHPKPMEEFIYETFEAFVATHPWVGNENIRPKSIAREMYELCFEFNDYVRLYGLSRSEGVLLRYLSQAYKAAVQTVPEEAWTEGFVDVLAYLHGVVTRTDSSLIQEWELLVSNPAEVDEEVEELEPVEREEQPWDVAADERAFRARVRNELHVVLRALADRNWEQAASRLRQTEEHRWTPEEIEAAMEPFFEESTSIDVTPRARLAHNTILREDEPRRWTAQQKIIDDEGNDDWVVDCVIDLTTPRAPDSPLIDLRHLGT